MLLSYRQSGVKALHIVIALNYIALDCNIISVHLEVVNLAMVEVNCFCNNKMITVNFFVEKTQDFLFRLLEMRSMLRG